MPTHNFLRILKWTSGLIFLANLALVFSLATGKIKTFPEIDWLDVLGEGGATFFLFAWFWFFLSSRPDGQVTRLLASGLALIFLAMFQDTLDEFIRFSGSAIWNTILQSTLLPFGMVLLTIGIYLLRNEQQVITKQLVGRERLLRDHRLVDKVTQISDVRYLYQQLQQQVSNKANDAHPFSIILLDINRFNEINRTFGFDEGDRFLHSLAELLLLNLRRSDLVCRYAGDRFVVLLAETGETETLELSGQLQECIAHFNYFTELSEKISATVSIGCATCRNGDINTLMEEAKIKLLRNKELLNQGTKAA